MVYMYSTIWSFQDGDYEENMVFRYVTPFSLAETYDDSEEPAVHFFRISWKLRFKKSSMLSIEWF